MATLITPLGEERDSAGRMLELWQESIDRASQRRQAPNGIDEEAADAAMEEALRKKQEGCRTCSERRYSDRSDDGAVSFQSPTKIGGDVEGAVRGHEREHVHREGARAKQEDRKVLAMSVAVVHRVCPECGARYVAGGETRVKTGAGHDNHKKSAKPAGKLDANA